MMATVTMLFNKYITVMNIIMMITFSTKWMIILTPVIVTFIKRG